MENRNVRVTVFMIIVLASGLANQRCSCAVVQFIFGDSLSDVGNNNYLTKSLARAALPWYGIDFGNGMPNGRFTNGRTAADIVGTMCLCVSPGIFFLRIYDICDIYISPKKKTRVTYYMLMIMYMFVGDNLGLPRPPAYLDPSLNEDMILQNGVNYASGGGGIVNETSSLFVSFIDHLMEYATIFVHEDIC